MKKLLLLSGGALSLTLLSFSTIFENKVEYTSLNNYKIEDAVRLSSLVIKDLSSEKSMITGSLVFKASKIFKTKAASNQVDSAVTTDTQKDCDCPKDKPAPQTLTSFDFTKRVIEKYDS